MYRWWKDLRRVVRPVASSIDLFHCKNLVQQKSLCAIGLLKPHATRGFCGRRFMCGDCCRNVCVETKARCRRKLYRRLIPGASRLVTKLATSGNITSSVMAWLKSYYFDFEHHNFQARSFFSRAVSEFQRLLPCILVQLGDFCAIKSYGLLGLFFNLFNIHHNPSGLHSNTPVRCWFPVPGSGKKAVISHLPKDSIISRLSPHCYTALKKK